MPIEHPLLPVNLASSLLLLGALMASLWFWSRKRQNATPDRISILMGGLAGGLIGAKLGYVLAEAPIYWQDSLFWVRMLAGKTILGGLLGGWIGIECAKKLVGERRILGDGFAQVIPMGIAVGRLGCLVHGCCPGLPLEAVFPPAWAEPLQAIGLVRWPAPVVEILFQFGFWSGYHFTKQVTWLHGQQFHLYMITYGGFRAVHEFFRATVRYEGTGVSPYMLLGLVCCVCGLVAFVWRARASELP